MAESPSAKRHDDAGLPTPKRQATEHNSVVLSERETQHGYLGRLPDDILCEIAKYLYWCMFPSIEFIPLLAPYVGNKHVITAFSREMLQDSFFACPQAWAWREYQTSKTTQYPNNECFAVRMIHDGFPRNLGMLSQDQLGIALVMIAARGSISDLYTAAGRVTQFTYPSVYLRENNFQLTYSLLRVATARSDIAFLQVALSLISRLRSWRPFEVARIACRGFITKISVLHYLISLFPTERTGFLARAAYACIKHRANLSDSEFQHMFKDVLEDPKIVHIAHLLNRQHMLGVIDHAKIAASVLIYIITHFWAHRSVVARLFARHIASTRDALDVWRVMLDPKNHLMMGSVLPHALENAFFRESVDLHAACMTFVKSPEDVDGVRYFFKHGVAATSTMFLAAVEERNIICANEILDNIKVTHEISNELFWALVEQNDRSDICDILDRIAAYDKLRGPLFDARAREFCTSSNNNAAIAIVCKILYQTG